MAVSFVGAEELAAIAFNEEEPFIISVPPGIDPDDRLLSFSFGFPGGAIDYTTSGLVSDSSSSTGSHTSDIASKVSDGSETTFQYIAAGRLRTSLSAWRDVDSIDITTSDTQNTTTMLAPGVTLPAVGCAVLVFYEDTENENTIPTPPTDYTSLLDAGELAFNGSTIGAFYRIYDVDGPTGDISITWGTGGVFGRAHTVVLAPAAGGSVPIAALARNANQVTQ